MTPSTDRLLAAIDPAALVAMLADLVRLNSSNPPGREAAVAEYVAGVLRPAALDVRVSPLAEGRANVLARLRGKGRRPSLMFCGHLDTVPPGEAAWQRDPFGAQVEQGRLYGRGAADMKGGLAAMLAAAVALARAGVELDGDVIVAGTAGEEVDCLGARNLAESGELAGVGALVVPEPTGLGMVTAHRGALWLRLTAHGKAAHGSMPHLGVNAILHLYRLLDRLGQHRFAYAPHPLLPPPTLNVGLIQGGTKINVVPERCQADVDLRTLPGQTAASLLAEIQDLIDVLGREDPAFHAAVEVLDDKPAVTTSADAPLIRAAVRAAEAVFGHTPKPEGASYFTDASVLAAPASLPTLILGPGAPGMAHQADEYVELEQVLLAARFYAALALQLLGR